MGPLVIAQFIVCGICLTIGLLHLALFARMSEHKTYLFFALMCSFCGAAAFLEALAYRAISLQPYNSIYKWQVTSQGSSGSQWSGLLRHSPVPPGAGHLLL